MVGFALYFSDSIDWGSALYLAEPLRVLRPWFGRSKYCQILLGINHIMEGATTDRIAEREIWHSVTRTVSFSSALGQWKTAIRYMQGSRDRYKDASIYGIEFRSEWRTDAKKPKHRKPKAKGKENTEHRRGSRHRN
jgi:hypothetical protein